MINTLIIYFGLLFEIVKNKNLGKTFKTKELKTKVNQILNDISVHPTYTYSNESNNPFSNNLSYHLVHEQADNKSKPIIKYNYENLNDVIVRPNKVGFHILAIHN